MKATTAARIWATFENDVFERQVGSVS